MIDISPVISIIVVKQVMSTSERIFTIKIVCD
jgi:hypothetical protein